MQLSLYLGALAGVLGCFPFASGRYHPLTDCLASPFRYSEFGKGWYPVKGPNLISALPPEG